MKKIIINVPANVEFLSDYKVNGKQYELPNGILNKKTTGCGASYLALNSEYPTILCSPRINLIENKVEQTKGSFLVKGGVYQQDIAEYLETTDCPKILTTFDSFWKIRELIDLSKFRIVVDEFQRLLSDSSFKSETEHKFVKELQKYPYVTYLSATPILDTFLDKLTIFKDVPYYEMVWEATEKVLVKRDKCTHPIKAASDLIKSYQREEYPTIIKNGKKIESTELVIFLNSVKNVCSLIKTNNIPAEDVNILVGSDKENDETIKKVGKAYSRGRIPLDGEKNKKFTFCTACSYDGVDFYSDVATTVVVSDAKAINTTVDITTDLVQIAGRQRRVTNPFRKYLFFLYNTTIEADLDAALELLKTKINLSIRKIKKVDYVDIEDKDLLEFDYNEWKRMPEQLRYEDYFIYRDKDSKRPEFNEWMSYSEEFNIRLQNEVYENGITIRRELEKNFDVTDQEYIDEYESQLEIITGPQNFETKMKKYLKFRNNKMIGALKLMDLRDKDLLKYYVDKIGEDRIIALGCKESAIKNELKITVKSNSIEDVVKNAFTSGEFYTTPVIKQMLTVIYTDLGIKKAGKASDLKKFLSVKPTKRTIDGKRVNGQLVG